MKVNVFTLKHILFICLFIFNQVKTNHLSSHCSWKTVWQIIANSRRRKIFIKVFLFGNSSNSIIYISCITYLLMCTEPSVGSDAITHNAFTVRKVITYSVMILVMPLYYWYCNEFGDSISRRSIFIHYLLLYYFLIFCSSGKRTELKVN